MLGGLLIDGTAWDQVGDIVRAEDFYRPDHRLIFEALARAGRQRPAGRRRDRLRAARAPRPAASDAGGLAYLGTLARDTPTAANVRTYAQIVRERALLRRLIEAGREIAASVYSERGSARRATWSIRPSSRYLRSPSRAPAAAKGR